MLKPAMAHGYKLPKQRDTFNMAIGVGASLVAEDLVLVLLGSKWQMAVPFVRWLVLSSAFGAMAAGLGLFLVLIAEPMLASM